jgi:RNA polymerase sigma-70 factor (ECF subfamily)
VTAPGSPDAEAEIRARCRAGDLDGAASEALRLYGAEIFGFLIATHKSEADANDVFSMFSERLWKGLGGFEWSSSLRTWAYVVARNASHRFLRDRGRRNKREVALSTSAHFAEVATKLRTDTLNYLRTESKTAVQKLRDELPPDDRTLLILRVDRDLEWTEIARVFLSSSEDGAPVPDESGIRRESARLRKRFQLVKDRLLKLGRERGLIAREGT